MTIFAIMMIIIKYNILNLIMEISLFLKAAMLILTMEFALRMKIRCPVEQLLIADEGWLSGKSNGLETSRS